MYVKNIDFTIFILVYSRMGKGFQSPCAISFHRLHTLKCNQKDNRSTLFKAIVSLEEDWL